MRLLLFLLFAAFSTVPQTTDYESVWHHPMLRDNVLTIRGVELFIEDDVVSEVWDVTIRYGVRGGELVCLSTERKEQKL